MSVDISIALDVLSVVFMTVLLGSLRSARLSGGSNRIYFALIVLVIVLLVSDAAYLACLNHPEETLRAVAFGCKSLYFATNTAVVFMWARYADYIVHGGSSAKLEPFKAVYGGILLINVAIVVVNLFTGCMFSITERGSFAMTPAIMWLFTVLNYVSVVVTMAVLLANRGRTDAGVFVPFILFPLVPFACELVQLAVRDIALTCSYAVSCLMVYQVWQNSLVYTDELTGLGNRRLLSDRLVSWFSDSRPNIVHGIMIDLDKLKLINDEFGHAQGDEALVTVASVIKNAAPKGAAAVRYGGDEFVVAWCSETGPDEADIAERLEAGKAQANSRRTLRDPIDFSMGSLRCATDECSDPSAFLSRLDASMYEMKRSKKARASSGGDAPAAMDV